MTFKPGDKVSFLDEVGEGEVIEYVSESKVIVLTEDGFEYSFAAAKLVAVASGDAYNMDGLALANSEQFREKAAESRPTKISKPLPKVAPAVLEIDLHIEQLVSTVAGLANHDIVQIQMEKFTQTLGYARQNRIKKVVFIHGVGEGKLRGEIRAHLKRMGNVEYHDASFRRYGQGATEVLLYG